MTKNMPNPLRSSPKGNRGATPKPQRYQTEVYLGSFCNRDAQHGGWGVVTVLRKSACGRVVSEREMSGSKSDGVTDDRMVLTAACEALESLPLLSQTPDGPITVYSESDLIVEGLNQRLPEWKAKGWRTADGTQVENQDLWSRLECAAAGRNVSWASIPSNDHLEYIELAQVLAYAVSRYAKKAATAA